MRPPLLTTVPSLPMFVVESGESRLTSQSEKLKPPHTQLSSDVTAGEVESEAQRRHHMKVQQIYVLLAFMCSCMGQKFFSTPSRKFIHLTHLYSNISYKCAIWIYKFSFATTVQCWSHWQSSLRCRSAAAWLLGLQVWIPLRTWMFISCVGSSLCDEVITYSEECNWVCVSNCV